MPALNSKFRRAVLSFPSLVMAGACLPDLSIIDNKLKESHQWNTAFSLINQAETDEERAIALGYLSHLYIDVIATIILCLHMRQCGLSMECAVIFYRNGQWTDTCSH
jgi:hypothetical protein